MPLMIGALLGPYQILSALGAGGMGEVYRARDAKLNRDVALKILPDAFAADPERLARFRREAQVLASLNHPNIGHIYGFEDSGATHALVMELVDGDDLAARIGRGPMPLAEALPIAKQIAEALEAAHEQGIIHRDLKPANIKVRDDGTVKVLDFGLAKALAPDDASGASNAMNSPTITARATHLGVILGTAAYMAPEQAKGKAVDRRADIWAFGVVLYEMLTGRRGYQAEDVSDTLAAVLTREVDWTALGADVPARLRMLVRDCLARDPKQRLRDIGEARRVLDRVINGAPEADLVSASATVAAPVRAAVWRVLPWTIAAAAVIAAAAFVAWTEFSRPAVAPRPVTRSKHLIGELAGFVTLSRDGTRLVYTMTSPKGFALALRQMDQFDDKTIPGSDGAQFPLLSPDGDWIAYTSTTVPTKIRKMPIGGGTSIALCDGNFGLGGAAWGDDDTIVFAGAKGLMRVSANGGEVKALTTIDTTKGETAHSRPQFLPGGRQLLFTIASTGAERPQFAILDLEKNSYRVIANGGLNGRYVPTGHLAFVRGSTLFAVPFSLDRLAVTGTEVPLVEGISTIGPTGTADYAFSDTGLLVYSEALNGQGTMLVWMDQKGTMQPIPGQRRLWGTGRLSPDGRRVVSGIHAEKDTDVWMIDLARGTPTRLTFGGNNDNPIWTPDGSHVVYSSTKDGKHGIYSVPADGSGQPEIVIAAESRPLPSSFTPDGKTLLYTQAGPNQRSRVLVLPPAAAGAAREPHPLRDASGADLQARVSPDGKWVAFVSTETGKPELYVLPFPGPGPKVRVSTDGGGIQPRWSRDGRQLFFWTAMPGNATLNVAAVQPGAAFAVDAPRELFRALPGTTWDVAPDGEHFLVEVTPTVDGGSVFATVTDWFEELRRRAPAKK
jgi:Tol biopolymer transport system component